MGAPRVVYLTTRIVAHPAQQYEVTKESGNCCSRTPEEGQPPFHFSSAHRGGVAVAEPRRRLLVGKTVQRVALGGGDGRGSRQAHGL